MKKNYIKKFVITTICFVITLIAFIRHSQSIKGFSLSQINEILLAANDYVTTNKIDVETEINLPLSLLLNNEKFKSTVSCIDDLYVIVKNDNGKYTYEPQLECSSNLVNVINNTLYMESNLVKEPIVETILKYDVKLSTTARTNQNVEVKIIVEEPILAVAGWKLVDENTLVKVYENNVTNELVSLISKVSDKKEQIGITVNNIDKIKPIVNGVSDGTIYNQDVTINYVKDNVPLDAKLNGETINNNYVVSKDGNYNLVVKDDIGNETIVNFTIDKTAPTIKGVENGGYYNHDVKIEFSDGNAKLNNKTFVSGQVVSEEGYYDLVVVDNVGNKNEISFTIDKTKPKLVDVKYNPELIFSRINSDIIVTLTYDEPIVFVDNNWQYYNGYNNQIYKHFTGEINNDTIIDDNIVVKDLANNESDIKNINFTIDKTSPIVNGVENGAYYNSDVIVSFNEGNASLNGLEFKNDSTISSEGKYELIVKDNVLNQTIVNFVIDKTSPTIIVNDGQKMYTSDFTIYVEADKNGVFNIPKSLATDNFDKNISVDVTGEVDITKLGVYKIKYTAIDKANNTSVIIMTVVVQDTIKPIIKLNGNNPQIVKYGHEYIESGAIVLDNYDDNTQLKIDTSELDVNKIGEYNIKYTVIDGSLNSSTATRVVKVVPTTISELIDDLNDCDEDNDCYIKNSNDNYVWYSGFLWRIIKLNSDKTLKLITEDSVSGFSYSKDSSSFEDSFVNEWLNEKFYKSLNNSDNIIVNGNYCIDSLMPTKEYSNEVNSNAETAKFAKENIRFNCNNIYKSKVGLLTIDEYNIIGAENSYLNTKDHFFTMTPSTDRTVWVVQTDGIEKAWNVVSNTYAIRPVITISSSNMISSGNGTLENPYRIDNDKIAKENDLLISRYTGEYVKIGSQIWRIVETSEKSTKLIMDSYYETNDDYAKLQYGLIGGESNVIQYLNNVVYNDIFTEKEKSILIKSKWYYNVYVKGQNPLKNILKPEQSFESYIGLIKVGELMSGTSTTGRVDNFTSWTLDYVNDSNYNKYAWYISWGGTSGYSFKSTDIRGLRPVININSNVTIKNGTGSLNNPYILNY